MLHKLRHQTRAANETRTRDPDLGKVVLYQLSYCRRCCMHFAVQKFKERGAFPECGCKGTAFSENGKRFGCFFSQKVHFFDR